VTLADRDVGLLALHDQTQLYAGGARAGREKAGSFLHYHAQTCTQTAGCQSSEERRPATPTRAATACGPGPSRGHAVPWRSPLSSSVDEVPGPVVRWDQVMAARDSTPGEHVPGAAQGAPPEARPGARSQAGPEGGRRRKGHQSSPSQWMSLAFAAGSLGFLLAPFPGYLALVGPVADAITFFVGSLLFTAGGALQVWLAMPDRRDAAAGKAAWQAAAIQFAGTLFFNATTFRALHTALSSSAYDRLVWRPDAFGSICFLVSGLIAYRASPRRGWWPMRGSAGWWQPGLNLSGCVLFGFAAVAGYVVPSSGSMLDLGAANWTTAAGAVCFLACAIPGLGTRSQVPPQS
jgi:hypothetical protein